MKKIMLVLIAGVVVSLGAGGKKRQLERSPSFDSLGPVMTSAVLQHAHKPDPRRATVPWLCSLCLPDMKPVRSLWRIDWTKLFLDAQISG